MDIALRLTNDLHDLPTDFTNHVRLCVIIFYQVYPQFIYHSQYGWPGHYVHYLWHFSGDS